MIALNSTFIVWVKRTCVIQWNYAYDIRLSYFSLLPYSEPDQDASPNNDPDWDWGKAWKEEQLFSKINPI